MRNILLKIVVSTPILIFLVGCGPYYYDTYYSQRQEPQVYKINYSISLSEVQRPAKATARYGPQKIEKIVENGINKYYFEDKMIKIVWVPLISQFSFIMHNKTDYSIRIIWDEAAYLDENALSHRIMHSGVKYVDRNSSQPPSVVIRKGNLEDFVVPTDNVNWREGYYGYYTSTPGGWKIEPLFPGKKEVYNMGAETVLESLCENYYLKIFQVLLPLQIEGVNNDYIFTFKIDDIEVGGMKASELLKKKDIKIEDLRNKTIVKGKKLEAIYGQNREKVAKILGEPMVGTLGNKYEVDGKVVTVYFDDKGFVSGWSE